MSVSRFALGGEINEIDLTGEEPLDHRSAHNEDFDRLYDEFSHRVIGLVRRFIADEDIVDDIVQETFLRAFKGGLHDEYRDVERARDQWPWLAAVARNLSLDHLRKQRVVREEDLEEEFLEIEAAAADPESEHLATRRWDGITEAFEAVCERQRTLLFLKHVEGLAYRDIASRQGMTVEAVSSALARARATFRDAYNAIAERNGLGVVLGGVLARAQSRLRAWRDRIASAPDATASALVASPAAVNAMATLAVLGTVGMAGMLGSSPPGATGPTPIVASSSAPPAVEVAAPVHEPLAEVAAPTEKPAAEVQSAAALEPVVHTEPAPEPAAETGGTEAEAHVDTNDVVPSEDAPAGASGGGDISYDDEALHSDQEVGVDVGGDGSDNVTHDGETEVQCPPPEKRGAAKSVVCPVLEDEAVSDLTENDSAL